MAFSDIFVGFKSVKFEQNRKWGMNIVNGAINLNFYSVELTSIKKGSLID